jgi:hypothetical protein
VGHDFPEGQAKEELKRGGKRQTDQLFKLARFSTTTHPD